MALATNVLMTNRQDARPRQPVTAARPDVLLALEPDYSHRAGLPRADGYGVILYPRLPLAHTRVQNLRSSTGCPPHTAAAAQWPLGHFFVGAPFEVGTLKRLPDVGPDHFPRCVELVLPAE